MREGVTYKRLGDVASYVNGYAFKPETWTDHGLPIVRIQNLNKPDAEYNYFAGELPDKFIINDGDLLISWSASLGAYFWNGGKAYLNQHIFKVVFDKSDIDKSYLKYAVESKLLEMKRNVHGSTMQHIVKGDFDNTKIPVPSLGEQQRIVSELDRLASIIADKQQQLRELDNLAQAIFYDMFGDPLTNPKGWEKGKLGEIADTITGLTYSPNDVVDEGGTIVLRSSNIQGGIIDLKDIVRVNKSLKDSQFVKQGDVLMCSRNGSAKLVGKVAMISGIEERMSWGAFMTIIRSTYNPYLLWYFRSNAFKNVLVHGKTTTVNQVTLNMLRPISLPVPPKDLVDEFAKKLEIIEKERLALYQSIAEFENLLAQRMELHFA